MTNKQRFVRMLLIAEIAIFYPYVYVWQKWVTTIIGTKKQLELVHNETIALRKEIIALEKEIKEWESDDFYKEKIARDHLQMARKGDILFYRGS